MVVWTATPSRADGGIIPGFYTEIIDTSNYTRWRKMDELTVDGIDMVIIGEEAAQKTRYAQIADVNVPFSEAWAEGYLCRISHQTFEVDLTKIKRKTDTREECKLSDLSESYIRNSGVLGRSLTDPIAFIPACEQALKYLRQHRELNPSAAMIVFSESDTAGVSNRHAKAIKKALRRLDSSLKIDIATSKSEDAPDELLERFIDNDHDVIIVKDMAGAGWDCKRVKVVLDLSSTRQDASTIQRWTRGATPDGTNTVMTLVAPNDALTRDIFHRWIAEEGGETAEVITELVAQFLREKKPKEDKDLIFASDAAPSFFSDNDNQYASAERECVVDALLDAFPWALSQESRAGISQKLQRKNIYIESDQTPTLDPIDKRIDALRDSVNALMDEIHRTIYWSLYNKLDNAAWGKTRQECYTELYKRASIPYENRKIATNRDLNQLYDMKVEAERWRGELSDAFN
jgi:superfamily II DNA or RNA helicase